MRIALLSWETSYSVYVGGVSNHVTELACALERKGHEVHVFTRMGNDDHDHQECIHGVHYHRCPFASNPDFIEEINNMCKSFVQAVFETEDFLGINFDIVHAHDWLTAKSIVLIKEGRGRKTILTMHSTEYGRCGNNFYGGASKRVSDIEWEGAYSADHIVAVSKTLKNELMWIYNIPEWKIDVIYNGISYWNYDGMVDPAFVRSMYGIGPLDPMVLFAGRITYQKGPDILLQAVPNIIKFYNNAKIVFVGDGDMRAGLEDTARHMNIAHATRFLGHKSGKDLTYLFKATDCVCVPSRNEPFGIVILEAWSAGKPVVASVKGGPSEFVWNNVNGLKVYDNPDSVSWGVGTMFSDFDHAQWMGCNGRTTAENIFSWDIIADEAVSIYNC